VFDERGELLNTFVVTVHKRFSPRCRLLTCHKNHPLACADSHRDIRLFERNLC
jgi:hypothetical protein